MGSGILLPLTALSSAVSQIRSIASQKITASPGIQGPWTPPQYSQPSLTTLIVPSTTNTTSGAPLTTSGVYVFDAVFRLRHSRTLVKTQHPVLTGAAISDHAYIKPARVVLEIGMSDAMASFTSGVWVGSPSKSVSAWQILKQLQISKSLVTLSTRLDTYFNMLIESVDTPDDNKTKYALRATITFEEIISASVSSVSTQSARPQASGNTSSGTVQSIPPSSQQVNSNVLPSTLYPSTPKYPNVPGAGAVSGTSLANVPNES